MPEPLTPVITVSRSSAKLTSLIDRLLLLQFCRVKNLVGAFYQPLQVISDISTLHTINERDFLAGYGEVVKYGLLADYDFYFWLEENFTKIN